jgi:hyperosmotically inducible protein
MLAAAAAALGTLAACDGAGEQGSAPAERPDAQPERRGEATPMTPQGGGAAAGAGSMVQTPETGSAADMTGKQGAEVADAAITSAVQRALASQPALADQPIEVKTNDGHVSLSGTVVDAQLGERAVQVAYAVPGVRGVANMITVKGGG